MKKKEKKYGLLKGLGLTLIIAFLLTWVLEIGTFGQTGFTSEGMKRLGITDIPWLIDGSLYFALEKVLLLLVIGGLYGVLKKISAYDRLISGIAKKLEKHKKITVVVMSVFIAALTSLLSQSFIVIIFIPFFISILNKMKLDKITIFATTFGSMLIGILGATYGTEGMLRYNGYVNNTSNSNLLIRAGVLAIGLVLFNFFTLSHMGKENSKKEEAELFKLEPVKETKKKSVIPIIIIGLLLLIISVLAYVNWNGFKITAFDDFHVYLTTKVSIGKDFFIFQDLLGTYITALGTWELSSIIPIIMLFTVIIGLCYRVKLNDFIADYIDGIKEMLIPVACVIGVNTMLAILNTSYYTPNIISKILSLTEGFNVVTMTIVGIISSLFHTDLGFSGFIFGSYFLSEYPDYMNTINVILPTLYGLGQFFVPTSAILLVGLSSLKIKYSEWFKFIWKFILGIFLCLLIIFILMATI